MYTEGPGTKLSYLVIVGSIATPVTANCLQTLMDFFFFFFRVLFPKRQMAALLGKTYKKKTNLPTRTFSQLSHETTITYCELLALTTVKPRTLILASPVAVLDLGITYLPPERVAYE
jgi:hypothetical protein